eukprot:11942162-Heterocapsa_arctica.AAC.1
MPRERRRRSAVTSARRQAGPDRRPVLVVDLAQHLQCAWRHALQQRRCARSAPSVAASSVRP